MKVNYRQEFFDRDYTAKEAYARLWTFARKYKFRLAMGVLCGVLTAGTLVPMFGMIQPALAQAEQRQGGASVAEGRDSTDSARTVAASATDPLSARTVAASATEAQAERHRTVAASATDKQSKKILKEYGKLQSWASKVGIEMQDDNEAMGLPLLFAVIIFLPLLALLRCGLVFLNHYCLAWAGMKTVRDVRCELMRTINAQSMQFHGRIDVGQLMSRCTSDPQQVQLIVQTVLQEVAQAPFEIAVSLGFIIWTAAHNHMLPTLGILAIGFPVFMIPVVFLSKVIRKWSRKALERFSLVGSRIHEVLTCVKAVKAYNTEGYEQQRYEKANDQTLKATLKALRWGLLVGPAVETVGILLLCAFLVWCFAADVKISTIVPMVAPLLIAYKPIKQLSKLQVQ
ncbi:MAG: hypothetical protein MJ249_17025, partial [Kiritimatiellae bacterium]|nr:hypothetical protein [Kiritimatiellia bacterium]